MDKKSLDEWEHLYRTDPEEYERLRYVSLESIIKAAPVEHRASMRLIQLECDTIRSMFPPLEATERIIEMLSYKLDDMSANLTKLRDHLEGENRGSHE